MSGITSWNVGDVDEKGTMWIANNGKTWVEVDIANAKVIANGTATSSSFSAVYDWAYVPGGGNYLYAISSDSNGNGFLQRFDRTAKTWAQVSTGYGAIYPSQATVGACYAGTDGFLYASDNTSGRIHKFNLDGKTAVLQQTGPKASGNDGAHCILNGT